MYLQDTLRAMSYEELEKLLPFPVSDFKTKPYRHQLVAFLAMLSKPGFLSALEMGLGKSKIVIDVCDFLRTRGHIKRTLVVALNSSLNNFGRQIEQHSDSTYEILKGTPAVRGRKAKADVDYLIINYEGLAVLCAEWQEYDDEGIPRKRRKVSKKMIENFVQYFDCIVFDDSHGIKNPRAIVSKIAAKLATYMKYRYCCTGTPYGNDYIHLFQQMLVLDFGETFGTSWWLFRAINYTQVADHIWVVKKNREPILLEEYHRASVRFEEGECYDLPEIIRDSPQYELTSLQKKYYTRIAEGDVIEDKNGVVIPTENKFIKQRQVLSGGLLNYGEIGVDFKKNPKLELCLDLIQQAISHTKVLLFHQFIFEAEFLEESLSKLKIPFAAMRGATLDNDAEYLRFQEDPKVKVMLAHPKSGGEAFDFVNCAVCIFFSTPLDIITRKQCEKRINRQTQESKRIWYYDLVGAGSVEIAILKTIQEGKDFHVRTLTRPAFAKLASGERI